MKVLLPAAEAAPVLKFGGLGDVIGSLPKALEKLGVDIDVVIPFFPAAKVENLKVIKSIEIEVPYDDGSHLVEVHKTKLPGSEVDLILFKNADYFVDYGKEGAEVSETEIFSFFNRAVVEYVKAKFNTYDLVHCQDWHTGLITHLLEDELASERPATLFTVHNLMYQGVTGLDIVKDLGIVPGMHPLIDWDIADGDLNFIQQGVASSDFINTVSPSYAKEIKTKEFGGDLAEILKGREARLVGILNGIDYSTLPRDFDESSWEKRKLELKKAMLKDVGLDFDSKTPVYSFVGRLDPNQKGLDIMFDSISEIVKMGGLFVLLGSGDSNWEGKFKDIGKKYKGKVSINIKFDIDLARSIYSGSDFLLVPSRYEPCGLIQMIALWYGTIPIVHDVGGLKDSVKEGKTGFKFDKYDSKELIKAITKANKAYFGQGVNDMIIAALKEDFSWDQSAKKYIDLYQKVIQLRLDAVNLRK